MITIDFDLPDPFGYFVAPAFPDSLTVEQTRLA
jgi:hypothetical protein